MENAQLKVYAWCAEEQRERFNWLAFFDMDEFLVIRDPDYKGDGPPDLKGFLNEFKMFPGLSLHWVFVGPSGWDRRPPSGGVLQHYTQCEAQADRHVKTIANTYYLDGTAVHPHNFHFRCDPSAYLTISFLNHFIRLSTFCPWYMHLIDTNSYI
jgi:hypothetical protein